MLRKNSALYDLPAEYTEKRRGRPTKYGRKAGAVKGLKQAYKSKAKKVTSFVYGKKREMLAYEGVWMSKSFKCPVKVVFTYYKNGFVALVSTDLSLSVEKILEYYSARWKIESGFKELKHDIGSQSTQARLKSSVINHLNMCMLAITIMWIATMNLPKLAVSELVSNAKMQFSFSQARRLVISNMNKRRVCKNSTIDHKNAWLQMIINLAA